MTDNNRLTLSQLKQLLRLYIRRGASANLKVKPNGELEAVPDKDTERRKEATIPAELLPLLEQLSDDGSIPQAWQDELKRYHDELQRSEANLSDEEKAALDQYRKQAENASESQLNQLEQAEEALPDNLRNLLEKQRRLRQSLAGKVTQAWKQKNMPEQDSASDGEESESGDDGQPDPNKKSKDKQKGKPDANDDNTDSDDGAEDGQPDSADQGDSSDDADADQSGDDGDADGDGNENGDSGNAESPSQSPNGEGQQGQSQNGQPSDSNPQGDGSNSDQQPEDTREGLEKYREELEKKSGDQGKDKDGDGDGEGDEGNDGDSEGKDGDADGENQQGKNQKGQQSQKEDSSQGLKDYEKELRKQQQEEQQKADQKDGDGDEGDGQNGQQGQPGQNNKGQEKADPTFNLSNMKADEADVHAAKKALERLLSRGRKNPQQLPRWNKRELTKRLATYRNLNLARKPTLEQKAILMIIDNSPSMAHLEKQSRALAAALSAAGGPNGATVIVCLSSNGDFEPSPYNKASQDGLWFVNGKCVGRLPEPPQNGGFNVKSNANRWTWFIKKYLPQRGYDVHIIGFYGDYDGAKQWSYISNSCKDIMCTWFNPIGKGQGPVMEVPNMSSSRAPSSPYGSSWGIGGEPGYTPGDKRYESFRGKYFLRVDTMRDIATALKKAIGL